MSSTTLLGKETSCYIDGELYKGTIIAIARYVNYCQYCFLIEGQEWGKWVPESALTEKITSVQPVSKQPKQEPNLKKETEKIPSVQPVSEELKLEANLEKEAKEEAKEEINALVKFVSDTQKVLQSRSEEDVQLILKSFEDAKKSIELSTKVVVGSLVDTDKQIRQWLQQTIQIGSEVINFIWESINELWSRYWQQRIMEAIKGQKPTHLKAKKVVQILKEDYPSETNRQIAERLIYEKALYATITAPLPLLVASIPKIGYFASQKVVKFLNIRGLMVEMIYQIGLSYGFDEFNEGDYLVIFSLGLFSIQKIIGLGLDFLNLDSIPDPLISPVTNIILFLVLGYAACELYEEKAKIASLEAYKALEVKVIAYSKEVTSEQAKIEEVLVEAISVKEELKQN